MRTSRTHPIVTEYGLRFSKIALLDDCHGGPLRRRSDAGRGFAHLCCNAISFDATNNPAFFVPRRAGLSPTASLTSSSPFITESTANGTATARLVLTGLFCFYSSGTSAHTENMARYIRYYLNIHALELGEFPAVETAAKIARMFIYNNKGSTRNGRF